MIDWKIGLELEMLAPVGRTRRDLAVVLAERFGGVVVPVFHFESEPSLVPGTPVFENLTLGFDVRVEDRLVARCVDDLTLQADLDREAAPKPGWFRVVSDDRRMLHLVARHGRADGFTLQAVSAVAELFGTVPDEAHEGMVRVADADGAPVCIAAPLPGERERPCELVTPPLPDQHLATLRSLLQPALDMGFTTAAESATHVHFDGERLCDALVLRNVIYLWETWGPFLKEFVGCNPRCVRLGSWPVALFDVVGRLGFEHLSWPEVQEAMQPLELSKYVDLNLKNLVYDVPGKHTVEVRVLPGMTDPERVLRAVKPFEALLWRAVRGPAVPRRGPAMAGRSPWTQLGWNPEHD